MLKAIFKIGVINFHSHSNQALVSKVHLGEKKNRNGSLRQKQGSSKLLHKVVLETITGDVTAHIIAPTGKVFSKGRIH